MLSYRYMFMPMDENYVNDSEISSSRIVSPDGEGFMVTPTSMDMHMHMTGVMYAPTDFVTFMLMAPYMYKSMDHLRRDGVRFSTESEGWGDLGFSGLVKVYDSDRSRIHLNLGVTFPTGSTDEVDFIPGLGVTQLPYPMQIGSGTWNLRPGMTYLGQGKSLSFGAQIMGGIPLGENDQGYSLGESVMGTAWVARNLSETISASFRIAALSWGNIDGRDENLVVGPLVVPTADPQRRGGSRVDLSLGINVNTPIAGHRLGIEAALPIYQNLDGPQLGVDWYLTVGWQFSF